MKIFEDYLKNIMRLKDEEISNLPNNTKDKLYADFAEIISNGYNVSKLYFNDDTSEYFRDYLKNKFNVIFREENKAVEYVLRNKIFDRNDFTEYIELLSSSGAADWIKYMHLESVKVNDKNVEIDPMGGDYLWKFFQYGIENFIDTIAPYTTRRIIRFDRDS